MIHKFYTAKYTSYDPEDTSPPIGVVGAQKRNGPEWFASGYVSTSKEHMQQRIDEWNRSFDGVAVYELLELEWDDEQ